jgi:hypothetical protein
MEISAALGGALDSSLGFSALRGLSVNREGAICFTDKHGQAENRAGCLLANTAKFTRLQLEQCIFLEELL